MILGLHERFWHSASGDLQSLLHHASMPAKVVKLVPEVVSSCAISKRFTKVKNRPTVRASHSGTFNGEVQLDYFQLWDQWFFDVATRYKTVTKVTGGSSHGSPHDPAQLDPVHSSLTKKVPSCRVLEAQHISGAGRGYKRQGPRPAHDHRPCGEVEYAQVAGEWSYADLAAAASFAQNATLNIGGYTPHMMVVGTFLDIDAPGMQAFTEPYSLRKSSSPTAACPDSRHAGHSREPHSPSRTHQAASCAPGRH